MTRKPFLAFALILVFGWLSGAPAFAADAWQTYANRDFGVSTSLPGAPLSEKLTSNGDGRTLIVLAASGDTEKAYMLRVDDLKTPQERARAGLNYTADRISTPERGPVISRTELTIEGQPAIDLVLGPDADGDYIRARMIVANNTLIQILTIQKTAPELDRFFTDFKLSAQ